MRFVGLKVGSERRFDIFVLGHIIYVFLEEISDCTIFHGTMMIIQPTRFGG